MAERKQAPVDDVPVEPRTRRGRRKMDDVEVNAAKAKTTFDEQQRRRRVNSRAKTAELAEKEKQDALRAKQRAARIKRYKQNGATALRHAMVIGPIVAPMTVAWTGQSGFATGVLGWNFLASLLYAAAYELTTVFSAWMYHEARKDGDKGWEYRLATWAFAAGAGLQQWWHYSDNWSATPRSVTYSTMTAIGVIVWELYARLIHRRALRGSGKLTGARPAIGLARWFRYPRISWTAWSIAVRRNFTSFEEMWTTAEIDREQARSKRDKLKELRTQLAEVRSELEVRTKELSSALKAGPDVTLERVTEDPEPPNSVPALTEEGPKAIEPPKPEPVDDEDEEPKFEPTQTEREAIENILDAGERINRTTCADYVRKLNAPIATKRAAELAAWGRENYPNGTNLKAVQ